MENLMGIETKTPGELIDLLFTTDYKCWWAQERLLDMSLTVEQRADEARKAQEYNARRNKLIRAIDKVLGFAEDSPSEKTYGSGEVNLEDTSGYTYFQDSK
jgi:hypothetical protein